MYILYIRNIYSDTFNLTLSHLVELNSCFSFVSLFAPLWDNFLVCVKLDNNDNSDSALSYSALGGVISNRNLEYKLVISLKSLCFTMFHVYFLQCCQRRNSVLVLDNVFLWQFLNLADWAVNSQQSESVWTNVWKVTFFISLWSNNNDWW